MPVVLPPPPRSRPTPHTPSVQGIQADQDDSGIRCAMYQIARYDQEKSLRRITRPSSLLYQKSLSGMRRICQVCFDPGAGVEAHLTYSPHSTEAFLIEKRRRSCDPS